MSPTYSYVCPDGHEHERYKRMSDAGKVEPCPECGKWAERVLTAPQRPIVKGGTPSFHGSTK